MEYRPEQEQELEPVSVDWQSWVDKLRDTLPEGATVADADAIVASVKETLRKQGHSIL